MLIDKENQSVSIEYSFYYMQEVRGTATYEYILYIKLDAKRKQWYKLLSKYGKKVQVGKDQEKAQSEKDSHSKNRGGKKTN